MSDVITGMTHVRCCLGTSKASMTLGSPLTLVAKQNDHPIQALQDLVPLVSLPFKVTLSLSFALWEGGV